MKFAVTLELDEREARDLCAATREMYGPVMASVHGKLASAIATAEMLRDGLEDDHGAPLEIRYRSCDIMLELWVVWEKRPRLRPDIEMVAAALPPDLVAGERYEMARTHVAPFVEAVKRGDPAAIAEVRRALLAQKRLGRLCTQPPFIGPPTDIPECQYDSGAAG